METHISIYEYLQKPGNNKVRRNKNNVSMKYYSIHVEAKVSIHLL